VAIEIEIVGKGGHAARPHESLDPIATAAQLISSLYSFVPRGADSHEPVVLSFGAIHAGDSCNSIPDRLMLRGTLRTLSPYARERAQEHIRRLGDGLASASTTAISIVFTEGPPALANDAALTRLIAREAGDALGADHVHSIPTPSMGGEDFANYLAHVPGAMFRVGCAASDPPVPLHSPRFDVAPQALAVAAKILARTAIAWTDTCTKPE
jgi:amidohydrolase